MEEETVVRLTKLQQGWLVVAGDSQKTFATLPLAESWARARAREMRPSRLLAYAVDGHLKGEATYPRRGRGGRKPKR